VFLFSVNLDSLKEVPSNATQMSVSTVSDGIAAFAPRILALTTVINVSKLTPVMSVQQAMLGTEPIAPHQLSLIATFKLTTFVFSAQQVVSGTGSLKFAKNVLRTAICVTGSICSMMSGTPVSSVPPDTAFTRHIEMEIQ